MTKETLQGQGKGDRRLLPATNAEVNTQSGIVQLSPLQRHCLLKALWPVLPKSYTHPDRVVLAGPWGDRTENGFVKVIERIINTGRGEE